MPQTILVASNLSACPAIPFANCKKCIQEGAWRGIPCGVDCYALIFIEEMSASDIGTVKNMIAERHRHGKTAIETCVALAATMSFDRCGNPIKQVWGSSTKTGKA